MTWGLRPRLYAYACFAGYVELLGQSQADQSPPNPTCHYLQYRFNPVELNISDIVIVVAYPLSEAVTQRRTLPIPRAALTVATPDKVRPKSEEH